MRIKKKVVGTGVLELGLVWGRNGRGGGVDFDSRCASTYVYSYHSQSTPPQSHFCIFFLFLFDSLAHGLLFHIELSCLHHPSASTLHHTPSGPIDASSSCLLFCLVSSLTCTVKKIFLPFCTEHSLCNKLHTGRVKK